MVDSVFDTDAPQSSIDAQQDARFDAHTHDGTDTPQVDHTDLTGRDSVDQHPQGAITDLVSDQATQDAELARLETDKADAADVVATFVFAAYLSLEATDNTAFPDLGAAWQDLDFITNEVTVPHWVTNEGNGQFSFPYEGVYSFGSSGSMEHNSSNNGRITTARLYNYTDALGAGGISIGTGRNQEATPLSANLIFQINANRVGKVFGLQIGNGDAYTGVNFQSLSFGVFNIGTWQSELGGF